MSKEQKIITKDDLLPLDAYTKVRRQMRKELVQFKKNRRVLLGPYATFYFECYETMIAQVQEMLYIEKGGDCLLYTSPSPRDPKSSRMPSSA